MAVNDRTCVLFQKITNDFVNSQAMWQQKLFVVLLQLSISITLLNSLSQLQLNNFKQYFAQFQLQHFSNFW